MKQNDVVEAPTLLSYTFVSLVLIERIFYNELLRLEITISSLQMPSFDF